MTERAKDPAAQRVMKYAKVVMSNYCAWFVVASLMIFAPVYRNGLTLVTNLDAVGQYYPAFLYIGQWLREHLAGFSFLRDGVKMFDLSIAMGENVAGALNYYGWGDPLNLLAIFATKDNGAVIFSAMFVLRILLAGLAFCAYARYMRLNDTLSKAAALVYAFSSYSLFRCGCYIEFLSPLIFLPLMLLGCERVWKEGKYHTLVLSTLYASLCNFYFLLMVALYMIPYCLLRTSFFYKGSFPRILTGCLKCVAACALGCILSLPVTFGFVRQLFSSSRSELSIFQLLSNPDNWKMELWTFEDWKMVFQPSKQELGNIPIIVGVFLPIGLLCWQTRRQKQCAIACLTATLLLFLPISDYLFSGFSSAYQRWHFLVLFTYLISFCVTADLLVERFKQGAFRKWAKAGIAMVCCIGLIHGGFMMYSSHGTGFGSRLIPLEKMKSYVDSPVRYSKTIQSDDRVYRVSADTPTGISGRPENVAMLNDYYGTKFWLSLINGNVQKLVNRLDSGVFDIHRGYGLNNSRVYESLGGVKFYFQNDNTDFPKTYRWVEEVDFYGEKWNVYQNPDALPLVYAFEKTYFEGELEADYWNENPAILSQAVAASDVEMKRNRISAVLTVEQPSYAVLAIPYSGEWEVQVDGTNAKPFCSPLYYLAIPVEAGTHDIRFNYKAF